jgi:hypothetical protein
MKLETDFNKLSSLEISPLEYYKVLTALNDVLHQDLRQKLMEGGANSSFKDVAAFLLPGSDGRKEKGSSLSKFELITILNGDINLEAVPEISQSINGILAEFGITQTEFKHRDSKFSLYKDNPNIIQPGRIADSALVFGDKSVADKSRLTIADEIIEMPGSKVDRIESLVKDARKVTSSGINRIQGADAVHFDLNSNSVFYNPASNQLSFKIGPLRLVQNTLLLQEVKHVRRQKDRELFKRLEASILPRLSQLEQDKMLNFNKDSISEIAEIYAFFLKLYHKSEEYFRQTGNIAMGIDEQLKIEVAKRLAKLNELMGQFKIVT